MNEPERVSIRKDSGFTPEELDEIQQIFGEEFEAEGLQVRVQIRYLPPEEA